MPETKNSSNMVHISVRDYEQTEKIKWTCYFEYLKGTNSND